MMNFLLLTVFGLCFDMIVGDSIFFVHPVVLIGKWISYFDSRFNQPEIHSPRLQRWLGAMLLLTTILISAVTCFALLHLLTLISAFIAYLFSAIIISSTIAWKGLIDAGKGIYRVLVDGDIEEGRARVQMIVGRDTDNLSETEIIRATVETLAENIVDAIVSPIFYACLGGAVLAIIYRAVNTLDSMVGYRNNRYQHFGFASARLDDVLNFLPARLTIIILFIVFAVYRLHLQLACRALWRDALKHPSPNSGIPEAMVAGAIGVELGGTNYYQGKVSYRAKMGTHTRELHVRDILAAISIVRGTGLLLFVMIGIGGAILWHSFAI